MIDVREDEGELDEGSKGTTSGAGRGGNAPVHREASPSNPVRSRRNPLRTRQPPNRLTYQLIAVDPATDQQNADGTDAVAESHREGELCDERV